MQTAAQIVQAWHDAVNAGDAEGAVACSHPEVEVGGPRGTGHGHDLLRGWLHRSGIRLSPAHDLVAEPWGDGERVVVQETARWTTDNVPYGAPAEPTTTWCVFTVEGGVVTGISRYEREDDVPTSG